MSEAGMRWSGQDPFASVHDCEEETRDGIRYWLGTRLASGKPSNCPCCGQRVQRYARSINHKMVHALELLSINGPMTSEAIALRSKNPGGDHAKLIMWGMVWIDDKGIYKITDVGRAFLAGRSTVPRYMYVYNGAVVAMSIEQMSVNECRVRGCHKDVVMEASL